MVLRIQLEQRNDETVLRLIGSITSPDVQELQAQVAGTGGRLTLDLGEVQRVDLDAAHFLAEAERSGIELHRVPRYVQEWIVLERARFGAPEPDGLGD